MSPLIFKKWKNNPPPRFAVLLLIFFFGRQKIYSINKNTSVPEVLVKYEQIQDTYGAALQKQRKKPNQDPTTEDKGTQPSLTKRL